MSEIDNIEKVIEDAKRFNESFINRERYPFFGVYQLFEDSVARMIYLMGWLHLIQRVDAIAKRERS